MAGVFVLCILMAEALGVALVVLILLLMGHMGGLSLSIEDPGLFNLHPFLMTLGFVFLNGNAMLTYKAGAMIGVDKPKLKLVHFIIQVVAFLLAVVALFAVFRYHGVHGYPQMTSLHSWMGMTTVVLFGLQLLFGFLFFLFPRPRESTRAAYKNVHVYFGCAIVGMVVVTALAGVTELIMMHGSFDKFTPVTLIANFFALTLVAFIGIVTFTVTRSASEEPKEDGPGEEEEKSALMEMKGEPVPQ